MMPAINPPKTFSNQKRLVVNNPTHLAMRPTRRMIVPSIMNNEKGGPSALIGPGAPYYTDLGCVCSKH